MQVPNLGPVVRPAGGCREEVGMFDGSIRAKPRVSMRGRSKEEEKTELIRRARLEREQRREEKERRKAALSILQFYRRR
jgi:hypothetical protein